MSQLTIGKKKMFYRICALMLFVFAKTFFQFSVRNRERIPSKGGFIVACSHTTWLDTIFLPLAFFPAIVQFMVKRELIASKSFGWFFRSICCFPVDRASPGPSSIKIPVALLKQGQIVGIMPTGTRQNSAALKQGAALIGLKANATILPAVYCGPQHFEWKQIFTRPSAEIRFGEPIVLGEITELQSTTAGNKRGELLVKVTQQLEQAIGKLFTV